MFQPVKNVVMLDKERELIFDLNSLCILEEKFKSLDKAISMFGKMGLRTIRTYLYAALSHYDDIEDEHKVGKLLKMADIPRVTAELVKAYNEFFER